MRGDTNSHGAACASASDAPRPAAVNVASIADTAIEQAIRRGDFDDLPGAGKPIPGLGDHHDPDWWIRRKMHTEKLTGLGPAALTLRVEDAALSDRLDALHREAEVRETLEDFNRRVRHARMQLNGGPPVITPTRDIDAEVTAWRERRSPRAQAQPIEKDRAEAPRRRQAFRWGRTKR